MRLRADIVIAGVIVVLCAYAVAAQLGFDPLGSEETIEPIAIGEVLDPDLVLNYVDKNPKPVALGNWYGEKATVFYTWSVPCPCVEHLEPRMRSVFSRFGKDQGVAWIAVDGEPLDRPETYVIAPGTKDEEERLGIMTKMGRIYAFYKMLLDPEQQLCRRLGFSDACQVAVLDGEGRLRYRGSIDHDYYKGKGEYLEAALRSVLAGRPVEPAERPWVYGCGFSDPESCEFYEGLTPK